MASKLTAEGRADFARLEQTIREGLETFVEVGAALAEIKERMLYKEVCSTFESYVQIRWGFSRRHAERQIAAAETVRLIAAESGPIGPTPDSEAVARPLTEIPAEKRVEVWAEAVEGAGGAQPTARQVAAKAAPHKPKRERTAAQEIRAREKREAKRAAAAQPPERVVEAPDAVSVTGSTGISEGADVLDPSPPEARNDEPAPAPSSDMTGDEVPELGTAAVVEGGAVMEAPSLPSEPVVGYALVVLGAASELPDVDDPRTIAGLRPEHRRQFMALSSWAIRIAGKCPNEVGQEAA